MRAYRYLEKPRFTVDLDYLVRGLDVPKAKEELEKASNIELDDCFNFGQNTSIPMQRDTPYGGDRFEIQWTFNNKKGSQTLKIDICAGDTVDEIDQLLSELAILGDVKEKLSVKIYPAEYIFAEKLQTAAKFGTGNTRLKDIVDMWSLMERGLDSDKLKTAIHKCFARRGTEFDPARMSRIFNNTEYIEVLEEALKKNFSNLDLPKIFEMMSKIEVFVNKLSSHNLPKKN